MKSRDGKGQGCWIKNYSCKTDKGKYKDTEAALKCTILSDIQGHVHRCGGLDVCRWDTTQTALKCSILGDIQGQVHTLIEDAV